MLPIFTPYLNRFIVNMMILVRVIYLTEGEKNGFFGKKHTKEQRERKRTEKLAAPKIKCYHCNKEVDGMNYARWHGDNCKHKDNK